MRTLCRLLGAAAAVALVVVVLPAQPPRGGGFGRGGFGRGGGAMLLTNKSVQEELKLSKEQIDKIDEHGKQAMEKGKQAFEELKDLPKEERREKMQAMMKERQAENQKFAKEVLKSEQYKRFQQIERQQAGLTAFSEPDVASALKLTDEQKEDIKKLEEDLGKDVQEMMREGRGDQEKMRENFKKIATMRKEALTKAIALLKPEQKKEWKELTGEPFEVKFEAPPGGFRKGKRGGKGGGGNKDV